MAGACYFSAFLGQLGFLLLPVGSPGVTDGASVSGELSSGWKVPGGLTHVSVAGDTQAGSSGAGPCHVTDLSPRGSHEQRSVELLCVVLAARRGTGVLPSP